MIQVPSHEDTLSHVFDMYNPIKGILPDIHGPCLTQLQGQSDTQGQDGVQDSRKRPSSGPGTCVQCLYDSMDEHLSEVVPCSLPRSQYSANVCWHEFRLGETALRCLKCGVTGPTQAAWPSAAVLSHQDLTCLPLAPQSLVQDSPSARACIHTATFITPNPVSGGWVYEPPSPLTSFT